MGHLFGIVGSHVCVCGSKRSKNEYEIAGAVSFDENDDQESQNSRLNKSLNLKS